ncbi:MAG TPA: creatininase family protein [Blastocatellia bacterium]|nr:creatininase family protein [Blastocatellia bacterium]
MSDYYFAHLTWAELGDLLVREPRCALILPVGSTEAHGPHLPLSTDVIIAEETAIRAARMLETRERAALVLPPIVYSVTDFSEGFTGSISIAAETATALVCDISLSLIRQGFRRLAVANAHLEPAHIATLRAACEEIKAQTGVEVAFPDVTRRRWAQMLTEEFQSGACHAGQYESSLVMRARPELVRDDVRLALESKLVSLSQAIGAGARRFTEIGGDQAYFGAPAEATAEEGERVFDILAGMIVTALDEIKEVEG